MQDSNFYNDMLRNPEISKGDILNIITEWMKHWDAYNLEGVMELIHEDIVFENFTGAIINGKRNLYRSWFEWFKNHGNFKFSIEDVFVDEQAQKVLLSWNLKWPSTHEDKKGKIEIRPGVDILHFKEGKILKKLSYSKTTVQYESRPVLLDYKLNS